MNAKQQWEAKTEIEKENETISNMLDNDFEEELIENEELNSLIGAGSFSIEKIKKCTGYKKWREKNNNRIKDSIEKWEKRMKGYFS